MSTVFEVYPGDDSFPSFGELLSATNNHLSTLLNDLGCNQIPQINVELRDNDTNAITTLYGNDPLKWTENSYAWFTILNVDGGTDAYYDSIEEPSREIWTAYMADERTPNFNNLNGFVFSDDGAWVQDSLPATGPDFLRRYFVIGATSDTRAESWATDCLGSIARDLST